MSRYPQDTEMHLLAVKSGLTRSQVLPASIIMDWPSKDVEYFEMLIVTSTFFYIPSSPLRKNNQTCIFGTQNSKQHRKIKFKNSLTKLHSVYLFLWYQKLLLFCGPAHLNCIFVLYDQVSNYFINAWVRLWKPMIEEMYAEMNRIKVQWDEEGTQKQS